MVFQALGDRGETHVHVVPAKVAPDIGDGGAKQFHHLGTHDFGHLVAIEIEEGRIDLAGGPPDIGQRQGGDPVRGVLRIQQHALLGRSGLPGNGQPQGM